MTKRSDHSLQLLLCHLAWHFGDEAYDSWHVSSIETRGEPRGSDPSWINCSDALRQWQTFEYFAYSESELEPAGGFERSVCRIRFGRSSIELHRLRNCLKLYHFKRASPLKV